jgi:hypothetical protein
MTKVHLRLPVSLHYRGMAWKGVSGDTLLDNLLDV